MLNNNTITKLHEMHFSVRAQAFRNPMKDRNFVEMPFEECFCLLVNAEGENRKSNRMTRLIKKADYTITIACVEDIEYHPDRKLDKVQIIRLAPCNENSSRGDMLKLYFIGASNIRSNKEDIFLIGHLACNCLDKCFRHYGV